MIKDFQYAVCQHVKRGCFKVNNIAVEPAYSNGLSFLFDSFTTVGRSRGMKHFSALTQRFPREGSQSPTCPCFS